MLIVYSSYVLHLYKLWTARNLFYSIGSNVVSYKESNLATKLMACIVRERAGVLIIKDEVYEKGLLLKRCGIRIE